MKLLLALIFTFNALCATTGTLTLRGTIQSVLSLSVTPVGAYNTLDLTQDTVNLKVAEVTEVSNGGGYVITLTSQNNGRLTNGTDEVAYTVRYDGATVTPTNTSQVVKTSSQIGTAVSDLEISYSGNTSLSSGDYTDTITLNIVAN